MKTLLVTVVALIPLMVNGCSTRDMAEISARVEPAVYVESEPWFSPEGYDDEVIDADTQEIVFIGNMQTSVERVTQLAKFHAAKIGSKRGASHFSLTTYTVKIWCSRAMVRATTQATYGTRGSLAGDVYSVDKVIEELTEMAFRPVSTYVERQKIFIAHRASCSNKELVLPSQVRANSER